MIEPKKDNTDINNHAIEQLEQEYLKAYHTLYQRGIVLKEEICKLNPPQFPPFAHLDLTQFNTMVEKLYTRYSEQHFIDMQKKAANVSPEFLGEHSFWIQQHAQDIAHMTGLPQQKLVHYQMKKGAIGLYDLVGSVTPLPHQEWVELYFTLEGIPSPAQDFFQGCSITETPNMLEKIREQYYQAGQQFMRIRDTICETIHTLFCAECEPFRKCHLFFKQTIYRILSHGAGLANWEGKTTGTYPVVDGERTGRMRQALAEIAQCLHVEYGDLLYIFRHEEEIGFMKLILHCHWIKEREALLVKFPHYHEYQRELMRRKRV